MTVSTLIRSILITSLCFTCIFSIASAKPSSEVYTVRYSYEKQNQQGFKRYVLIPQIEQMTRSTYDDFNSRSRALFNKLKGDKSRNYGDAKFASKGKTIFVFLDRKKDKNHAFIVAESVYTFTANGAEGVKFPKSKFKDKLYVRADIEYPAYQLTLPYWQGLPPNKINSALLNFPDGHFATSDALEKLLHDEDARVLDYFKDSFQKENILAIKAIVAALNLYPVKNIDQAVLPSLSHKNTEIRKLAITALKSVDNKEVNQALRKVMDKDSDVSLQDLAAKQLSQSKDPEVSVFASFYALKSQDTATAITACKALAKAKSKETNTVLTKRLQSANSQLAQVIIDTLLERKANRDLVKLLDGELSVKRKVQVAHALTQIKKAKDEAYKFLVTQPDGDAVIKVCQKLAQDKEYKNVISILSKALTHPDAEARIAAAQALVELNHKKSLATLAKGDISDPDSGFALHQAIRDLYKKQKDATILADAARSKTVALKSAATGTLGLVFNRAKSDKFKRKAFTACVQLAQSKTALVRSEAVRCFGDVANKYAKEQIVKLLDDTAVEVQRMLYFSLRHFEVDLAKDFLLKGLSVTDAMSVSNAVDTLSLLKLEDAFEKIKEPQLRQHKSARVRAMTMQALGRFALIVKKDKQAGLVPLLDQTLAKDEDLNVRQQAALSLGNIVSSDANFSLSSQLLAGNIDLTFSIIQALAKQNNKSAASSLEVAMETSSFDIRKAAYVAVSEFKDAKAIAELKKILNKRLVKEKEKELQELIKKQLAQLK